MPYALLCLFRVLYNKNIAHARWQRQGHGRFHGAQADSRRPCAAVTKLPLALRSNTSTRTITHGVKPLACAQRQPGCATRMCGRQLLPQRCFANISAVPGFADDATTANRQQSAACASVRVVGRSHGLYGVLLSAVALAVALSAGNGHGVHSSPYFHGEGNLDDSLSQALTFLTSRRHRAKDR